MMILRLEPRLMLSVTHFVSGETLYINGSEDKDVVVLRYDGGRLRVIVHGLEERNSYAESDVGFIYATLGSSDDTFCIRGAQADGDNEPATICGGLGNDRIEVSTSNSCQISAGAGVDVIRTTGGADRIYGGAGDDMILAGDGNDCVFGGAGRDLLRGGIGADIIKGEGDDDIIYGDRGGDILLGGDGFDRGFGGPGVSDKADSSTEQFYQDL